MLLVLAQTVHIDVYTLAQTCGLGNLNHRGMWCKQRKANIEEDSPY
jgi:hypothetical protein